MLFHLWQARKNEGIIVGTPNKECKNGPPSHTARELLAKSIACGCNFPLSNGKINDQRVLRLTNGRLTVIYCWGRAPTAAVFVLRRLTLFWCLQFHIHTTATRGSITKTRGLSGRYGRLLTNHAICANWWCGKNGRQSRYGCPALRGREVYRSRHLYNRLHTPKTIAETPPTMPTLPPVMRVDVGLRTQHPA